VQAVLKRNGNTKGAVVKNKYGALLRGLLFCHGCRCGMTHTYSVKAKATKRYRYYVCVAAQKKGWSTCASKSIPAGQIEKFVTEQVRRVGRDPAVLEATLRQVRQQGQKAILEATSAQRAAERELARHGTAVKRAVAAGDADALVRLNEQVRLTEQKVIKAKGEVEKLKAEDIRPDDLRDALSAFEPVWEQLSPREQARVIRLLVARVDYDGGGGSVSITFRPSGIKTLAEQGIEEVAV
jgi:site-specific DNA recombinase